MMKSLKKFGGAIMLYAVIFFGIVAIASSVNLAGHDTEAVYEGVVAVNEWFCKLALMFINKISILWYNNKWGESVWSIKSLSIPHLICIR